MNNLSDLYGNEFYEWALKNSSEKNIVKGEYLVDDREPKDNRRDCVDACKVESSLSRLF